MSEKLYTLPPLPYEFGALEPYIDAVTMEIHHDRHHQTYIDAFNTALESAPELKKKSLTDLLSNLDALPESVRTTIRNNGGGHYNHSLFWEIMSPRGGGKPVGEVSKEIEAVFGSFDALKEQLSALAKTRFGSGWAWLSVDSQGKLVATSTANQDSPLSQGLHPIVGIDVWEHAYYLKYQNKRVDYIAAWWHVVNWHQVEENYRALIGK